jgi:hypothetical protein
MADGSPIGSWMVNDSLNSQIDDAGWIVVLTDQKTPFVPSDDMEFIVDDQSSVVPLDDQLSVVSLDDQLSVVTLDDQPPVVDRKSVV